MILFFLFIFSFNKIQASAHGGPTSCPPGQVMSYNAMIAVRYCTSAYQQTPVDCIACQQHNLSMYQPQIPMQQFPAYFSPPYATPWWAQQGNMHFPNMNYPGAWNYTRPGMNGGHYPGNGQVFAAKPNIYAHNFKKNTDVEFHFPINEQNFLATTPVLNENNQWKTTITDHDQFNVEGVLYDYLFYDIRLPKENMQFERGLCTSREEIIIWMLRKLEAMSFPKRAIEDFEQHWRVKIPDYQNYCIYPQYNAQLDQALPITMSVSSQSILRVLYILTPEQNRNFMQTTRSVPLPTNAPLTPPVKASSSFYEWGVAFLESE